MFGIKKENIENQERAINLAKVLRNCSHMVGINADGANHIIRFLDMLAGYYWKINTKTCEVEIRVGNTNVRPINKDELYKMLQIEINKSAIYELQKSKIIG